LFAFGFTVWAFLFDRRRVAWGGWCVGSVLGVLPMLPWIAYLIGGHSAAAARVERLVGAQAAGSARKHGRLGPHPGCA